MKNYNLIYIILLFALVYINSSFGQTTHTQTFTKPISATKSTSTTTTTGINTHIPTHLNKSPLPPNHTPTVTKMVTNANKYLSLSLGCPKMKVNLYFSGYSDQCKVDSDCKLYGDNQKCCFSIGCGYKCVRGIPIR